MIRVEHLGKTFENEILRDITVDINDGDVISVIGPSGCGKSTFMRCLNMLETPTTGKVFIDGQEITAANKAELAALRRKMGMVFQSFNLFKNMTIIENVMLGPVHLLGTDRQTAYDEGMKLLDSVGLGGKSLSYPEALSGGQKQRAAIARTLAMKPEVILFDEPTSALDPTMVGEVLGVMQRLADQGMTMLIVTHEMSFAENIANRVFYIDEKGIYEQGTPEQIFHDPQMPKTRDFIYRIRSFTYDIHGVSFDFYELLGRAVDFMTRHRFTEKRIRSMVLLGEEIIFNLLFPAIGREKAELRLTFRYSEKLDSVELIIEGEGIHEDLLEKYKDKISESIVRHIAGELRAQEGRLVAEAAGIM